MLTAIDGCCAVGLRGGGAPRVPRAAGLLLPLCWGRVASAVGRPTAAAALVMRPAWRSSGTAEPRVTSGCVRGVCTWVGCVPMF